MMNKLNVLYEDNHIIVVEKPAGVPTQADYTKDDIIKAKELITVMELFLDNEMVLNNIARADEIFDGRYHDWFEEARRIVIQRIAPAKKHKLREYLPEWLLNLYHGIVPPILRHKL